MRVLVCNMAEAADPVGAGPSQSAPVRMYAVSVCRTSPFS